MGGGRRWLATIVWVASCLPQLAARGEEIPQRIIVDDARPIESSAATSGPKLQWRPRNATVHQASPIQTDALSSATQERVNPLAPASASSNAPASIRRMGFEESSPAPRLAGPVLRDASQAQATSPLRDPFGENAAPRLAQRGESSVLLQGKGNESGTGLLDPPSGGGFKPRNNAPSGNDLGDPGTLDDLSPPADLSPPNEPKDPVEESPKAPAKKSRADDLESLLPPRPMPGKSNGDRDYDSDLPKKRPIENDDKRSDLESSTKCDRVYNQRDCCREGQDCSRGLKKLSGLRVGDISLDTAPSFRPDTYDAAEVEEYRKQRLARVPSRAFKNRQQQVIAEGKLTGFSFGRLAITTGSGEVQRILYRDLSDDDLCFVSAWWGVPGLPLECALGDEVYQCRAWTQTTFTWKASALCHKPLYFEQVQLERYGHDAGPVLQPVLSGAHFFASLPLLPYKMGIHPPNECLYSLGYYRPGSCAPWLLPPVPLSARGALMQAGAVVGTVAILP